MIGTLRKLINGANDARDASILVVGEVPTRRRFSPTCREYYVLIAGLYYDQDRTPCMSVSEKYLSTHSIDVSTL